MIGIRVGQVSTDRVDNPLRHLTASRAIEVNDRLPVDGASQGGKLPTRPSSIEIVWLVGRWHVGILESSGQLGLKQAFSGRV
jgi:hypothetical protein